MSAQKLQKAGFDIFYGILISEVRETKSGNKRKLNTENAVSESKAKKLAKRSKTNTREEAFSDACFSLETDIALARKLFVTNQRIYFSSLQLCVRFSTTLRMKPLPLC